MNRMIFALTCVILTGCQGSDAENPSPSAADEVSTAELLKIGSPKACSTSEVRETVFSTVKPTFRPDDSTTGADIELGLSQFSYSLEVVTLESVDQAVHNVTCEANLVITDSEDGKREFPIRYVVKPSVDDPQSFVLSLRSGEAKTYLQMAAYEKIGAARDERLAEEMAAAPSEPADTAAAPVDTPSAEGLEDVSNALDAEEPASTDSNQL